MESKVLKVQEHLDLLSAQFLVSTFDASHPCHELSAPYAVGLRKVHKSLRLRHGDWVEARLIWDPGGGGFVDVGASRTALHTAVVEEAIRSRAVNIVLGARPPAVSSKEPRLPRAERCLLAQLRSGYSIHLNSYKARIRLPGVLDVCPICQRAPHSVSHLFACDSRRTALGIIDLWRKPQQSARFLQFLMSL